MRPIALLAVTALLAPLQDPPKITLEKKATVQSLTAEIAAKFQEKLKIDSEVEESTVEVKVRDAGFYQALDAVCRAHGGVTYLGEDDDRNADEIVVKSGAWVEVPTCYSGSYKLSLNSFTRLKMKSDQGEHAWTRVNLDLHLPPSVSNLGYSGEHDAVCTVALDGQGRDVRPGEKSPEPDEVIRVGTGDSRRTAASHTICLKDFDLDRGLSRFEGKLSIEVAKRVDVPVNLEPGNQVETPTGKVTVLSVNELEKGKRGSKWLIALKYVPKEKKEKKEDEEGLQRVFEYNAKLDRVHDVYIGFSWDGEGEFQIRPWSEIPRPSVLLLRARLDPRKVEIPFSFKDVSFKKN